MLQVITPVVPKMMLQCVKLFYSNQKVFTMGFSNQPLVILALVLIAYGSLLASFQIVPEIYRNYCNDCACKDMMSQDATGVVILLAGLVLLSTIKPSCRVFIWVVFALFFGIGAHGVLMIFSSMRAYARATKHHCDFLKIFFVCVAIGSLLLAISALVAAVFFCHTCNGCFSLGAMNRRPSTPVLIRPRRRYDRSTRFGGPIPLNSSLV